MIDSRHGRGARDEQHPAGEHHDRHRRGTLRAWSLALLGLLATALVVLIPSTAEAAAPDQQTVYSGDGMWRAQAHAWTTNLVAYKSIGTTVSVQHKEWACSGLFCIDGHRWQWVSRRASAIDIGNTYEAFPPSGPCTVGDPSSCVPSARPRSCHQTLTSSFDCFEWGVMFAYSSGDPAPHPASAQLNVKTVHGNGAVYLPDGQFIRLGPVQNSFWF